MSGTGCCECCGRLIVWQEHGIWQCFYCNQKNTTTWKCSKHIETPQSEDGQQPMLPTQLGDGTASLRNFSKSATREDNLSSKTNLSSLGAGDTELFVDFLSKEEADWLLSRLGEGGEIEYQQWYHMVNKRNPLAPLEPLRRVKRALCNPNSVGQVPLYRFPVNHQERYGELVPMTPAVDWARKRVEARLKLPDNTFNHAVVLVYKDCDDCIGFHKDKTLDLEEISPIVSVSLGLERPYVLRDDIFKPAHQQSFNLPHGAMLVLGPESNQKYYHSVRQMTPEEMIAAERASGTKVRVSLTFRAVATFRDSDGSGAVYGKGAKYQTLNWPEALRGEHRLDSDLHLALPAQLSPPPVHCNPDPSLRAEAERRAAIKARREPLPQAQVQEEVVRVMAECEEVRALLEATELKRAKATILARVQPKLLPEGKVSSESCTKQIKQTIGRCLSNTYHKTNSPQFAQLHAQTI